MRKEIELSEFFQNTSPKLYRFFYTKLHNREIAQDLLSDTYLRYAEKIRKDELPPNERYLYGIAKNVFSQYLSKKYKMPTIQISDEYFEEYVDNTVDQDNSTEDLTIEERAMKYIDMLPEKQRIVLRLRMLEKMSLKEIALQLNKGTDYVKTTQRRGFRNLEKLLIEFPEEVKSDIDLNNLQ